MTTGAATVAAVDLGASSGRVIVGSVRTDELVLEEVHRFPNEPVALNDGLHWDALRLVAEVLDGLRRARSGHDIASVAVDSWGVDYGLIDDAGSLVGNPIHYRDRRHEAGVAVVHAAVSPERLYARNGLQELPFNTIFQLAIARGAPSFAIARTMLLMPDLIGYWLTGEVAAERTNASTTGLLDARTGLWMTDIVDSLDLPMGLFADLRTPGDNLGHLTSDVAQQTGLARSTRVSLVGSHDTASAVVGVPGEGDDFAYIVCGTWSLVGVELDRPILDEPSRAARFTNEGGVDGRVRFLHNVMGLWLLQESMRTWERSGTLESLDRLLAAAAAEPDGGPIVDPDDPTFLPPGDMPARITDACVRSGQPVPATRAALTRCILESLARAYARTIDDAERLSGRKISVINLVGGGARNSLLCVLTARASGRPVVAGPVEATAIGNILVQARALGVIDGDLDTLRALIRATQRLERYEPSRPSLTLSA